MQPPSASHFPKCISNSQPIRSSKEARLQCDDFRIDLVFMLLDCMRICLSKARKDLRSYNTKGLLLDFELLPAVVEELLSSKSGGECGAIAGKDL